MIYFNDQLFGHDLMKINFLLIKLFDVCRNNCNVYNLLFEHTFYVDTFYDKVFIEVRILLYLIFYILRRSPNALTIQTRL